MNNYTFYNVKVGNRIYAIRMNRYYLLTYEYKVLTKTVSVCRQHGKFGGKKITKINFTLLLMKYCNKICDTKYPITITVENNQVIGFEQQEWFCSKEQMSKHLQRLKQMFLSNIEKIDNLINNKFEKE